MNATIARSLKAAEPAALELSHIEFAQILVASRRAALDLTVDQVRELAAAVLILDQQLDDANRRMACMMLAEADPPLPAPVAPPEIVHVPLVTGGDPRLTAALEALVRARRHLQANRFSSEENQARQKFEKAAFAVADICTPKQRT